MIDRMVTPYMLRQAEILLARSSRWSRGWATTGDGQTVNVVSFLSSRTKRLPDGSEQPVVYFTRVDGACCSCPGFKSRQACSHAVACKMEAEQARDRAAVKPRTKLDELVDAWLDEGPRPVVSAF